MQRTTGISNTIGSSTTSVPSPSLNRLTPHDKKKSRTQPSIHMNQGLTSIYFSFLCQACDWTSLSKILFTIFFIGGGSTSGFGLNSTHFDSSSTTSSCSSSTPSSPALALPSHISANHTPTSASQITQFRFPGTIYNFKICFSRNDVNFCGHLTTDVRQADRAQSAETLLSPLSHVPLSAKNSTSVINSVTTLSPGTIIGFNFLHSGPYFKFVTNLKFFS